jgi:hypothetical protein
LEAGRRSDPMAPSGMRDLVAARIAAQIRMGIDPSDVAPLYSSEVETVLIPILMRMGRGDAPGIVAALRRDFRRQYGDQSEIVLQFMLCSYQHRHAGIAALREAARATAATAA